MSWFWLVPVPLMLALGNAVFRFFPYSDRMYGAGSDPQFNVWTLEVVWRHLSRLGPLGIFSDAFWQAPIFYPQKLALALSESQLYLGVLTWPLRRLFDNAVLTMNWAALMMNLAAWLFCFLWLRSLGVKRLAGWGALFFSAGGWIQLQALHYQNLCIFVLPLALWRWQRFRDDPRAGSLLACSLAFGWIGGWNIYFQMFANLIFFLLLAHSFWCEPSRRRRVLALGLLTVAWELPIAWKYLEVGASLGSMAVPDGIFKTFNSSPLAVFARVPTFLQAHLPFYPQADIGLEGGGFLGVAWLVCAAVAGWRCRRARPWLLAALAAWIVSFGPNFGLFYLVKLFPGFHGLRCIGRAEVLVALFSLAGIFIYLESLGVAWLPRAAIAAIALELLPGQMPPSQTQSMAYAGSADSAFAQALRRGGRMGPLLVLPDAGLPFQLEMLATDVPLYYGYSGRELTNEYLLIHFGGDVKAQLAFSGARQLAVLSAAQTEQLKRDPAFSFEGCFDFFEFHPCLFSVNTPPSAPSLRLDRDASWSYPVAPPGTHVAELRADRDGMLDYATMNRCRFIERLRFPGLPPSSQTWGLPFHNFKGFAFRRGDLILDAVSRQYWFRLPERWRPERSYEIRCD